MKRYVFFALVGLGFCLVLAACAKPPAPVSAPVPVLEEVPRQTTGPVLERVLDAGLPEFADDSAKEPLKSALAFSLEYYGRLDPKRQLDFGGENVSVKRVMDSLKTFGALLDQDLSPRDFSQKVKELFTVYRCKGEDGDGKMLFTGYYEPVIRASREKSLAYPYPIYRVPDDVVTVNLGQFSEKCAGDRIVGRVDGKALVPYWTREDIDGRCKLAGRGLEAAWAADLVDVFFLHIQGSGRLLFEDGTSLHVNYAGENGRAYKSIGSLLIQEGRIPKEQMSMQCLRAWLESNPDQRARVLNHNPSYVFFRLSEKGPFGCAGVPVTPGRSVALDKRLFPLGALAYVRTKKPVMDAKGDIAAWEDMNRFVLDQDTGGAIRGPGRLDFFWGSGDYAQAAAGYARHPGELYFLILKN